MILDFIHSERLNKILAAYYVKKDVNDHNYPPNLLVNKVKGYREGEEDPYFLLQMGAHLAGQLIGSDGYSNGNKLWHLSFYEDNWFIPALDEQEVEAILRELLEI